MDAQTLNAQETALVRQFFAGRERGFFVEVGANEPRERSQTWHLEQAGWDGILIEPQPDIAEQLRRARRAKVFAVACSSPDNAGRTMPLHVVGPLSSLERGGMAAGASPELVIEVPVRTLDEILIEAQAPSPIEFLSIDVEGHELNVLQGFDLARWRPRLILLEDHVTGLAKHRFLTNAGYRLIRRFDNNGWYVPADTEVSMTLPERWQILRKYYLALPFRMLRNASRRMRGKVQS